MTVAARSPAMTGASLTAVTDGETVTAELVTLIRITPRAMRVHLMLRVTMIRPIAFIRMIQIRSLILLNM